MWSQKITNYVVTRLSWQFAYCLISTLTYLDEFPASIEDCFKFTIRYGIVLISVVQVFSSYVSEYFIQHVLQFA